jgi:cytochrome c biogenesis protein CcmG/thiol:disulfide interchange protein DsbE
MMPMSRSLMVLVVFAVVAAACTPAASAPVNAEPLPTITADDFLAEIRASPIPVVVNIWASWCGPCRSEAPLLAQAYATYGDQIRFIGVDVRDTQRDAQAFIARYGLDFEHYFDPRETIPTALRVTGVPHTFFFAPGGELRYTNYGVIDERTLATQIDDLLRSG